MGNQKLNRRRADNTLDKKKGDKQTINNLAKHHIEN